MKDKKILELTYAQQSNKPKSLPKQQSVSSDSLKRMNFDKLYELIIL